MTPPRAVLGAGPHGREIAALYGALLFDDDPRLAPYPIAAYARPDYVIGAAWPRTRRQIAAGACCVADSGIVVFPGAVVSPSAVLGAHSHVGANAVVSHGCTVGEFVNICPGAVIGGEVSVADDVFVGAGAVVIHGGLTIGRGALIGAGAVVLTDVSPGVTVVGNPARILHKHRVTAWDHTAGFELTKARILG